MEFEETLYNSIKTKTIALGMALGEDIEKIQKKVQNESKNGKLWVYEKVYKDLLDKKRNVSIKQGEWARDIIDLKSYIFTIDICKNNPKEQKRAYDALCMFLKIKELYGGGLAKWEFIVNDPAFGEMEIFNGGEP